MANIIGGMLPYEGGELYVMGQPTSHYNAADWERYRRDMISFISQDYGILPGNTVSENVESALILSGCSGSLAADRTREILEKVELSEYSGRRAAKLSSGQKQRLAIARALLKDAKIYIFDDSFSALDFSTDAALRAALAEDVSDATVIIVAQRINTIAGADQIIVLDEGRLAGIGTHSELLDSCKVYREIAMSQLSEEELAEQFGGRFAQATDGKEAE
jgi:ATP-binding cassette subfamily B protein